MLYEFLPTAFASFEGHTRSVHRYAVKAYVTSAKKALKSIIIDLGELPPKTHALIRLKGMLFKLGLHTSDLEDLKLNFLTRMHTSTRYPSRETLIKKYEFSIKLFGNRFFEDILWNF